MSPSALPLARRVVSALAVVAVMAAGAPTLTSPQQVLPASGEADAVPREEARAEMATLAVPEVADEKAQAQGRAKGLAAPRPAESSAPATLPVVAELSSRRTSDYGLVGVTWAAGSAAEDLQVQVRTRTDESWTGWEDLDIETFGEGEGRGGTIPSWVGESDGVAVRMLSHGDAPADVRLALIDGGTGLAIPEEGIGLMAGGGPTTVLAATSATTNEDPDDGVAPKPHIVSRRGWGVDRRYESSCSSPRFAPNSKGVVLHHTAGANGYSRSEAPGIVRGIHLYHTRSLGWCDIGYNFLVDAFGTIYAGRRGGQYRQVRGAHAGNWDANHYLTGVSMMGNFEERSVPRATKRSVVQLVGWRMSLFGLYNAFGRVRIDGTRIRRISGHRDIYQAGIRPATATACPGRYGDQWLNGGPSGMRAAVKVVLERAQNERSGAGRASVEPETQITDGPGSSNWALDDEVTFRFTSSVAKSSFACTFNGRSRECDDGVFSARRPRQGMHDFSVQARTADKADQTPERRTFHVPVDDRTLWRNERWGTGTYDRNFRDTFLMTRERRAVVRTHYPKQFSEVALIANVGRRHGTVRVFVGSTLLGRVSLQADRFRRARVLPVYDGAPRKGRVRVVVTSRGKPVRIDGIALR